MGKQKFLLIFLVGCVVDSAAKKVSWQGPDTVYVGFPGVTVDRSAFLTKYCTDFWVPETGEWIITQSIDIVDPHATQVIQFPEIIKPEDCTWLSRWWNSWWRRSVWARQTGACVVKKFSSVPYSVLSYGVNRSRVNMGQAADVACVHEQLFPLLPYRIQGMRDHVRTVWLAYSRGVSALLRYVQDAPITDRLYFPDAIILEGGLDVMQHFLQHIFDPYLPAWVARCKRPDWLINIMLYAFRRNYAPQYKPEWDGLLSKIAEDAAKKIPHDIPILLVASKADELVSHRLMIRIYNAFRRERQRYGYDNVHLLLLNNARHSYYVDGVKNAYDRDMYEQCVHAFYKKYGCAYDARLAALGNPLLGQSSVRDPQYFLLSTECLFCHQEFDTAQTVGINAR